MKKSLEPSILLTLAFLFLGFVGGCAAPPDPQRMQRGYVYYLDGAGGGGVTNWAGGVREGLRRAGYDGAGEMFRWETGLGVWSDQTASNEYKRDKAGQLAQRIVTFHQQYPNAPINLIGLSAGTVIAVFALEELPPEVMVDNVILLSGSLSASHDLTRALQRVRGKMYVTTSDRDPVLGALLPFAGTADRDSGTSETIGVEGPRWPPGASAETRQRYASQLNVIPWKEEFARYGNYGGHTDTVSTAFVERYVAPLVKTSSGEQLAAATPAASGMVANPLYERWAGFAPGSWVLLEGQQVTNGVAHPIRIRTTLISKTPYQIVLYREQFDSSGQLESSVFPQTVFASSEIEPADGPMTHPACQSTKLPDAKLNVGQQVFDCKVLSISVPADFRDWGSQPKATVYSNAAIPGEIVQVDLHTRLGDRTVEIAAKVSDYYRAGK